MKKLLTLLATVALALWLAIPTFAQDAKTQTTDTTKTQTTQVKHHGKKHRKHAHKKGAMKGKKEGQQGTTPGQGSK